jgi:hypothetical protein
MENDLFSKGPMNLLFAYVIEGVIAINLWV